MADSPFEDPMGDDEEMMDPDAEFINPDNVDEDYIVDGMS
jgi:hypothetical protein